MEGRPILTPQQIMERQIQMVDRFLDRASAQIARPVAHSSGEGAK